MWNLNRCNKQQDTELGIATRCMLERRGWYGLSLSPDRGHEGRIREVLQEDWCSSMYSKLCVIIIKQHMHSHTISLFPHSGILIQNTDCCLFSQVKNKPWLPWVYSESGTIANTYNHWNAHCKDIHCTLGCSDFDFFFIFLQKPTLWWLPLDPRSLKIAKKIWGVEPSQARFWGIWHKTMIL